MGRMQVWAGIVALAAAACDGEGVSVADGQTVQLAPPPTLTLEVAGVLRGGSQMQFTVSGLQPGETVWIAENGGSYQTNGFCPPQIAPTCLDLDPAPSGVHLVGSAVAAIDGVARRVVNVPSLPTGYHAFQAFTRVGSVQKSDLVFRAVEAPSGARTVFATWWAFFASPGDAVPGVGTLELYFALDEVNYPGPGGETPYPVCVASTTVAFSSPVAPPPCPDCEFVFQATALPGFVEGGPSWGDCRSYLGAGTTAMDNFFPAGGLDGRTGPSIWAFDAQRLLSTGRIGDAMLIWEGGAWVEVGNAFYTTPSSSYGQTVRWTAAYWDRLPY